MAINVYVISEPSIIDFIEDGDLEGFKEELSIDDTLIFHDPETFDTEAEVIAFTSCIAYGLDDRAPASLPYSVPTSKRICRSSRPSRTIDDCLKMTV